MTQTGRKRRSDFGVKRGSKREREDGNEALLRRYREDEARRLAAFSNDQLRDLVARLQPGSHMGRHVTARGAPGLAEVYSIDLVAKEVLARRWPGEDQA